MAAMKPVLRVFILVALACLAAGIVLTKQSPEPDDPGPDPAGGEPGSDGVLEASRPEPEAEAKTDPLPRLVDLGADKCIPCKKMAPILDALREEFAGTFEVEFIDVWKRPEAAEPYDLRMIPTQIFLDSAGNEVFRHEGFLGREEILATWNQHGVPCGDSP